MFSFKCLFLVVLLFLYFFLREGGGVVLVEKINQIKNKEGLHIYKDKLSNINYKWGKNP